MLAVCLCAAMILWFVLPAFTHAPQLLSSAQERAEFVQDHGHAHDDEEDLIWALHGHSHDAADHDHSQAFLIVALHPHRSDEPGALWRALPRAPAPTPHPTIDRPPRL